MMTRGSNLSELDKKINKFWLLNIIVVEIVGNGTDKCQVEHLITKRVFHQ